MLTDLSNVTFRFFAVNKSKWNEIVYNAEDLINNVKALPKDSQGTGDTRSDILYHCYELLDASLYGIMNGGCDNCVCLGSENCLFPLFEKCITQDEVHLAVEHSCEDSWSWNLDVPRMYGIADKDQWESIRNKLAEMVALPAVKLNEQTESVENVLRLYKDMEAFTVNKDDVILVHGMYEEPEYDDY
jgi:hypothetical protein